MNRITWPALLLALLAGCFPARRIYPVAQVSDSPPAPGGPTLAEPSPDYVPPPAPKPPPDRPPARLPEVEPDRTGPPPPASAALSTFANRQRSAGPAAGNRSPDPQTEPPSADPRPRRIVPQPTPNWKPPAPDRPPAPRCPDLTVAEPAPPARVSRRPAPQATAEGKTPAERPAAPRGPALTESTEGPAVDRPGREGMQRTAAAEYAGQPAEPRPRPSLGPTVRMVNGKRLRLGFQVRSAGGDPVPVELWYTRDGKGWQRDDSPPQLRSPYVMEVREEGVYGLSLIPCSGARSLTPQAGDAPQFWVSVDWTRPTVTVLGVEADLRKKALSVRWSAGDDHLAPRPITLSYAEQPGGPWVPLATNLKNTGSFWGPLPPAMPPRFYLRVEAADQGGNVGEARTLTPVVLDSSPPPNKVQVLGMDVSED